MDKLVKERDELIVAISELDKERAFGRISSEDYKAQKRALEAKRDAKIWEIYTQGKRWNELMKKAEERRERAEVKEVGVKEEEQLKKAPSLEEIEIHDKIVEASIDQGSDKLRESIVAAILDPKAPLNNIRGIDIVEIIFKASKSHLVSMVEYSDGMARGVANILKELGINYNLATIKLQALNNWNLKELQVVELNYYKYKRTLIGFISYVEAREGLTSKVVLKRRLEGILAHIERLLDHIDDLKDFF